MEKIAASIAQIAAEAVLRAEAEARAHLVDLPPPVLEALKAWILAQPDPKPSVPEAMRRGLSQWLADQGYLPDEGLTSGRMSGRG